MTLEPEIETWILVIVWFVWNYHGGECWLAGVILDLLPLW